MKKLIPFYCLLLFFACNKNSNELAPVDVGAKPEKHQLFGQLNNQNYIQLDVEVLKKDCTYTSNYKVKYLQNDMKNIEAYLLFAKGSGNYMDSIYFNLLQSDTSKNQLHKGSIDSLKKFTSSIVITKIDVTSFSSLSPHSSLYKSGSFTLYKDTSHTIITGTCKGYIAGDGKFKIWLKNTMGDAQLLSGLLFNDDTICQQCNFVNATGDLLGNLKLKKSSSTQYFDTSALKTKFSLQALLVGNPEIDSVVISLKK